jgi:hypothetical protein
LLRIWRPRTWTTDSTQEEEEFPFTDCKFPSTDCEFPSNGEEEEEEEDSGPASLPVLLVLVAVTSNAEISSVAANGVK